MRVIFSQEIPSSIRSGSVAILSQTSKSRPTNWPIGAPLLTAGESRAIRTLRLSPGPNQSGRRRVIDELPTIRELSDENGVLSGLVTQGESVSLLGEQYLSPFR